MAGVASKAAAAKPQAAPLSLGTKLWAAYLIALQTRPIFTKSATQLVLSGGQELTAQALVGEKQNLASAARLAAYGFFISGPVSHYLFELMNKVLGPTSSTLARILWSSAVTLPVQVFVFRLFVLLADGKAPDEAARLAWRGLLPSLKKLWQVYPAAQFVAYRYLPPALWLPFFQVFGFVMGTYLNVLTRRGTARPAAPRK